MSAANRAPRERTFSRAVALPRRPRALYQRSDEDKLRISTSLDFEGITEPSQILREEKDCRGPAQWRREAACQHLRRILKKLIDFFDQNSL
jgi:hypothetical protein